MRKVRNNIIATLAACFFSSLLSVTNGQEVIAYNTPSIDFIENPYLIEESMPVENSLVHINLEKYKPLYFAKPQQNTLMFAQFNESYDTVEIFSDKGHLENDYIKIENNAINIERLSAGLHIVKINNVLFRLIKEK